MSEVFADSLSIQVGGIVFGVHRPDTVGSREISYLLSGFTASAAPEVIIQVRNSTFPGIGLSPQNKIFSTQGLWSVYRIDGRQVLTAGVSDDDGSPIRVAVFDSNFKTIEIFTRVPFVDGKSENALLEWPLGQKLMITVLAGGRGLMAHGCGVADGDRGYLFLGDSGDGKSTLARLWGDEATILNDDRVVIRQMDDCFRIFGTPWHGDYTGVSQLGVALDKIFILKQATLNSAVPVVGVEACSMILTRSFPPFWDKEGMSFSLDFISRLVEAVPCYNLGFVPDSSILDFVKCAK